MNCLHNEEGKLIFFSFDFWLSRHMFPEPVLASVLRLAGLDSKNCFAFLCNPLALLGDGIDRKVKVFFDVYLYDMNQANQAIDIVVRWGMPTLHLEHLRKS